MIPFNDITINACFTVTPTVRCPLRHSEGREARQIRTCFQGTHHLARGLMKYVRTPTKSRHWQSDMALGRRKESLWPGRKRKMQGIKGKLSRD